MTIVFSKLSMDCHGRVKSSNTSNIGHYQIRSSSAKITIFKRVPNVSGPYKEWCRGRQRAMHVGLEIHLQKDKELDVWMNLITCFFYKHNTWQIERERKEKYHVSNRNLYFEVKNMFLHQNKEQLLHKYRESSNIKTIFYLHVFQRTQICHLRKIKFST